MWIYEKKLQHPVNIKKCDVRMAKYLVTQYGGPLCQMSQLYLILTFVSPLLTSQDQNQEHHFVYRAFACTFY